MKALLQAAIFFTLGAAATFMLRSHHAEAVVPPTVVVIDRESVEGLPVPIYPGTRVTRAEVAPPGKRLRQAVMARIRGESAKPAEGLPLVFTSQLSATEARAIADARVQLDRGVTEWLRPIPGSWKPPTELVDRLIVATHAKSIQKDYGVLYEAKLETQPTPEIRKNLVQAYQHELVTQRMETLAGIFAFVLICLATLAGYIRTDEATKGYYTHWLRTVAAAGVGASGVLIYQFFA